MKSTVLELGKRVTAKFKRSLKPWLNLTVIALKRGRYDVSTVGDSRWYSVEGSITLKRWNFMQAMPARVNFPGRAIQVTSRAQSPSHLPRSASSAGLNLICLRLRLEQHGPDNDYQADSSCGKLYHSFVWLSRFKCHSPPNFLPDAVCRRSQNLTSATTFNCEAFFHIFLGIFQL